MGLMSDRYLSQLKQLLPRGAAWQSESGSVLTAFLDAASQELARVHLRADALMDDIDPATTVTMLEEWEHALALPDNCSGELRGSVGERRMDVLSKLASIGGQSPSYFINIARALGYEVSISEYRPFVAGMTCGQPLYGDDWAYTWAVNAPATTVRSMVAGSPCGQPLRSWGNGALECRIRQLAPAHTVVLFIYGAESYLLASDGTLVLTQDNDAIQLNS